MKYWDHITERLPQEPIRWPDGARIAVLSLFDYQAEVGEWTFPDGTPNYGQITEASYGGRVGIWRLLDILDRRGIKATFDKLGEDVNDDDILALVAFAREHRFTMRFIEYMDVGNANDWTSKKLVTKKEIVEKIHARFPLKEIGRSLGTAPAVDYGLRSSAEPESIQTP